MNPARRVVQWAFRWRAGLRLIGFAAILCLGYAMPAASLRAEDATGPTPPPTARPDATADRTFALIVGCGEYPFLRDALGKERYEKEIELRGPENDVVLMRRVLTTRLGVPEANIESLVGWKDDDPLHTPTRKNILRALVRLSRDRQPSDRVLLYFSGHGSQEPDESGDEDDGLDEVFLPADTRVLATGDKRIPGGLSDDELGERAKAIRDAGAHVFLVMDCCHAGTMARGGDGGLRMRSIQPTTLGVPKVLAQPRRVALRDPTSGERESMRGISALYACGPEEKAGEMEISRWHGILTWCTAAELSRSAGRETWSDVAARVASSVRSLGVYGQHPSADGARDVPLADGPPATPEFRARVLGRNVEVHAGRLDGLSHGAMLSVRPVEGDAPAFLARVDTTMPFGCDAMAVDGASVDASIMEARATLVESPLRTAPVRLAITDAAGRPLDRTSLPPDLSAALAADATRARFALLVDYDASADRNPVISAGGGSSSPDWLLVVDGGRVALRPARLLAGDDTPFDVDAKSLPRVLAQIARVENLVRLATDPNAPAPEPGFRLFGSDPNTHDPNRRPGDHVRFVVRNESKRTLDVWMFLLDASYGVTCLFPSLDQTARVEPDAPDVVVEGEVNDDTLGEEHLLVVAVPKLEGTLPADLRWLTAPPLGRTKDRPRGAAGGGTLGERLAAAAFGGDAPPLKARGAGGADEGGMLLRSWTTAWPAVEPPEKFPSAPADVGPRNPDPTDGPPDLSKLGPKAMLATSHETSSPSARGYDLLVGGDQRPDTMSIALDGGVEIAAGTTPDVRSVIASHGLHAAIALRWERERRIAAYDRDADGRFDLVLVDVRGDPARNERWTLESKGWRVDRGRNVPWLRVANLDATHYTDEQRAKAITILRGLVRK